MLFPNIRLVPGPKLTASGQARFIGWVVPFDDTHFRVFTLARVDRPDYLLGERSKMADGKWWDELTDEEHQRYPGDYESQKSQGDIPVHSREFLATTDHGVAMLRRMMAKQIKVVANGGNPVGVTLGADTVPYHVVPGNYFDGVPAGA